MTLFRISLLEFVFQPSVDIICWITMEAAICIYTTSKTCNSSFSINSPLVSLSSLFVLERLFLYIRIYIICFLILRFLRFAGTALALGNDVDNLTLLFEQLDKLNICFKTSKFPPNVVKTRVTNTHTHTHTHTHIWAIVYKKYSIKLNICFELDGMAHVYADVIKF